MTTLVLFLQKYLSHNQAKKRVDDETEPGGDKKNYHNQE